MPSSQIMNTPKPDQASDPPVAHSGPSHEEIARRAYQLWEERGGPHGSPEEDWHRAQRELRVRSGAYPVVSWRSINAVRVRRMPSFCIRS
jgi:hypothetical protein